MCSSDLWPWKTCEACAAGAHAPAGNGHTQRRHLGAHSVDVQATPLQLLAKVLEILLKQGLGFALLALDEVWVDGGHGVGAGLGCVVQRVKAAKCPASTFKMLPVLLPLRCSAQKW